MNFEELLKQYQDGTLPENQRAAVEQEIEKVALIEEYLALEEVPQPDLTGTEESARQELKAVKRRIDRRTRRTVLAVVAGVLAILVLLQFIVFPALNQRICDTEYGEDGKSDFNTFLAVFSNLHIPLGRFAGADAVSSGFGTETVTMGFFDLNGQNVRVSSGLTAGILGELTNRTGLQQMGYATSGWFAADGTPGRDDTMIAKTYETLAQLPEYVRVTAAVTTSGMISLTELEKIITAHPEVTFLSAAVNGNNGMIPLYLDLQPTSVGFGDVYNDEYPQLWQDDFTAAGMQQHLLSELRFVTDHKTLALWLNPYATAQNMGYAAMVQDIETNGAQIYGLFVQGSGSTLKALGEDLAFHETQGVQIVPVNNRIAWY